MPKCAVKKCKNYTLKVQKRDGVSYFHFPQNEIQRDKWTNILSQDREDEFYKPNASSVICSEHFCEDDMYLTEKGFKRIKKTAIPNIQLKKSGTEENKVAPLVTENLKSPVVLPSTTPTFNTECTYMPIMTNFIKIEELRDGESETESPGTSWTSTPNFKMEFTKIPNVLQLAESKTEENKIAPLVKRNVESPYTPVSESTLAAPLKLRKELRSCKKRLFEKNKQVKNLQKINRRLNQKNATLMKIIDVLRKQKHTSARKLALTLYFNSPAAYRYIRTIFHNCLLHLSTLFQWYKIVDAKPGNTSETHDRLKEKSQSGLKEIVCSLIADEMAIKQQIKWYGVHYTGVVDMGLGKATDNVPITHQVYKAEMNIVNIRFEKCHAVGVKVVSINTT